MELVKIAGYLHDIGNLVNRAEHSQSGAVMTFRVLDNLDCDPEKITTIVTAIGNHDEGIGQPVNAVAAALILADKSDVRRVRNADLATFDIRPGELLGAGVSAADQRGVSPYRAETVGGYGIRLRYGLL